MKKKKTIPEIHEHQILDILGGPQPTCPECNEQMYANKVTGELYSELTMVIEGKQRRVMFHIDVSVELFKVEGYENLANVPKHVKENFPEILVHAAKNSVEGSPLNPIFDHLLE